MVPADVAIPDSVVYVKVVAIKKLYGGFQFWTDRSPPVTYCHASDSHTVGLYGWSAKERDFIIHLAPTPIPDEGDLSSEDEEALPSTKSEQTKPKHPDSIPKVVDATISQHTRQVIRMLPGGLDVIGVYVVTPQAEFNSSVSQSKLRSVLAVAHKTASKLLLDTAEVRTEKIILHVCTQTFKIMCKIVDVAPSAPSLQSNAELKFQRGGIKWQQLSYSYNINLNFWLPKDKSSQSLYKTIIVRPYIF
ncbi:protein odr-4 homolog [Panulirus ornatus]|uniref:protein odr-4 homolog n=1 Tax=Panulirus ornatus TaxID=150431 RepID=UPI003A85F2F7